MVTSSDDQNGDQLIHPVHSSVDAHEDVSSAKPQRRTKVQRNRWIVGGALIVVLGVALGLVSLPTYVLASSGAAPVNLNQVAIEDPKQGLTSKTTPRTSVLASFLGEHSCVGERLFPNLEANILRAQVALDRINKMGRANTFPEFFAKLQHIVDLFNEVDLSNLTYKTSFVRLLNQKLQNAHFTIGITHGYDGYIVKDSGLVTPFVLKQSKSPMATSVFSDSRAVEATKAMSHVIRIHHVFNQTASSDSYHPWYLEEGNFPGIKNRWASHFPLEEMRTMVKHVIIGLKQLEQHGMGAYDLEDYHNVGKHMAVRGKKNPLYKIKLFDSFAAVQKDEALPYKERIGLWLLKVNDKMHGSYDVNIVVNVGTGTNRRTRAFYGKIGESLEFVDFVVWCLDKAKADDGITWENVLETHPFLTNGTLPPEARNSGRLAGIRTFW